MILATSNLAINVSKFQNAFLTVLSTMDLRLKWTRNTWHLIALESVHVNQTMPIRLFHLVSYNLEFFCSVCLDSWIKLAGNLLFRIFKISKESPENLQSRLLNSENSRKKISRLLTVNCFKIKSNRVLTDKN